MGPTVATGVGLRARGSRALAPAAGEVVQRGLEVVQLVLDRVQVSASRAASAIRSVRSLYEPTRLPMMLRSVEISSMAGILMKDAAAELGIGRATLYRKIAQDGISVPRAR